MLSAELRLLTLCLVSSPQLVGAGFFVVMRLFAAQIAIGVLLPLYWTETSAPCRPQDNPMRTWLLVQLLFRLVNVAVQCASLRRVGAAIQTWLSFFGFVWFVLGIWWITNNPCVKASPHVRACSASSVC
jgi:hypothetical protein